MDFAAAIKAGFKNYSNFRGVASRSAFWYWRLFVVLVSVATTFVPVLGQIASLGLVIPDTAVGIRRSRDAGISAWWQLLWIVPTAFLMWKFQAIIQWTTALAVGSFDPDTATDEQLLTWHGGFVDAFGPWLLSTIAVQLFFFITWLLPTKTAAQGNKLVK